MKRLRYDRVIVITVMVALLSMGVGLLVLSQAKSQLVRVSTEEYKQQQELIANQVAETLRTNIVTVQNQLHVMATMSSVQNIDAPDTCNAKLLQLLQVNHKQLGNLGRVGPDGIFACSVNSHLIGQDSAQYGTYIQDLIADPEHKPVMSRINKPIGTDSYVAAIHVPVYQDGVFRGTLGGAIYFDQFQDAYLRSISFGKGGHAVVLDDNGDILFHPDRTQSGRNLLDPKLLSQFEPQQTMRMVLADVRQGRSGAFDYSMSGTRKAGLYRSFAIPDTKRHWAVVVTIPIEDLDAVVNQAGINRIFLSLVGLFTVTTALLTFLSLRNILRSKEIQRVKNDFISITSHQLRTPATVVKQTLGIVRSGFYANKREMRRFIDAAYESNENQLSIIENILSVSKLEAGRLEVSKETVALQDIVRKPVESLRMSAETREHTLVVEVPAEPVMIQADPTKLHMAIENLLSNAIKYTPVGGTITVRVSHKRGRADIDVQDTGKGIASADIPNLFNRFYRLRSDENSHIPGTGLGLYLTKKIVELHGGTIIVTSREGKGTTFTIRLPLA